MTYLLVWTCAKYVSLYNDVLTPDRLSGLKLVLLPITNTTHQ